MKNTAISLYFTPQLAEQRLHLLDEMRHFLWQYCGVDITEAHQQAKNDLLREWHKPHFGHFDHHRGCRRQIIRGSAEADTLYCIVTAGIIMGVGGI